VGAIPVEGGPDAHRRKGWPQLVDGWRALVRTPFLLATTTLSLASALVLGALQGLILPVHFTLTAQPGMLGFVLTSFAAGMLVGGGAYAALGTRGRRRSWYATGLIGTGIGYAVVATLFSAGVVFAGAFVVGLSGGLFGALIGVLMIERIPEGMRGRIMGTQNALLTAVSPAGIMIAAVITEFAGVLPAALVFAGIWLLAIVFGLCAPSLRALERRPGDEGAVSGGA
jgi:MFS family permease